MSRRLDSGVLRRLLWLPFAVLLVASANLQSAIGQDTPSSRQSSSSGASPQSSPAAQSSPSKPDQSGAAKASTETKITAQQAEQLFRDVDTILSFASKDTALEIKHSVKRRLT